MTHEERSKWLKLGFMFILATAIVCGVWFYREKIEKIKVPVPQAVAPKHAIEIIHFHLPGQAQSEQLADHLNRLESKYGGQVLVTRVDVRSNPERVKTEKITHPPEVLVMAGTSQALRFQGLWPRERIEERVEEILRGLRRMEKGWMPPGVSRR